MKDKALECIEKLEELSCYDFQEVVDIMQDNEYDDIYQDIDFWYLVREFGIWSDEDMDYYCKEENNDFQRLVYFLADVNSPNRDYFFVDAYVNAHDLYKDTIETFVEELVDRIKEEYEIEK